MDYKRYLTVAVLGVLLLSMVLPFAALVPAAAAETIVPSDLLYIWGWDPVARRPYVEITVTIEGLIATRSYVVKIVRLRDNRVVWTSETISGVTWKEISFDLMDVPSRLYGTYEAQLWRGGAKVASCYFGIGGLSGPGYNVGQKARLYGGGAKPGAEVSIIEADPDVWPDEPAIADSYGDFIIDAEVPFSTDDIGDEKYVIFEILTHRQTEEPVDRSVKYFVSNKLFVWIGTDKTSYMRTETIEIEVLVLYQDYTPASGATVLLSVYDGEDNPIIEGEELTFDPDVSAFVGSCYIGPCNATGDWTIYAYAEDIYGNFGDEDKTVKVTPAILRVESVVEPPAVVTRGTYVTWRIKVTYPDGTPVKNLNLALSEAFVKDMKTGLTVRADIVAYNRTLGLYTVRWFVVPEAEVGRAYAFIIKPNGLEDECGNYGPAEEVASRTFSVEVALLTVTVKTYTADFTMVKRVFVKKEPIGLEADVRYPTGARMTTGTVVATIYFPNGTEWDVIELEFNDAVMKWRTTFTPPPIAGEWAIVVEANDGLGNRGTGRAVFWISGLSLTPSSGTVPPIGCTVCQNLTRAKDVWLVTASVFTDPVSGKKLGTEVVIEGFYLTPNAYVNVTVDWLPYLEGYTILLAKNVRTDGTGYFKVKVVFPTTIMGIYEISVVSRGVTLASEIFKVIPGMILTPDPVIGSALIKVIATGLPAEAYSLDLLVNKTDALSTIAGHAGEYLLSRWYADKNGTLVSESYGAYIVRPGFIMPAIEPGTYAFDLVLDGGSFYNCTIKDVQSVDGVIIVPDSVKVINAFKELGGLVSDVAVIKASIAGLSAAITEVKDGVATIKTDIGALKVKVDDLIKALSDLNAIITEVRGGVATIRTDVGVIKSNVDTLAMALDGLKALVVEVGGDVAVIKTDVGNIKVAVGALDAIKSRVDAISTKVDTVSGKVDTVSGKVDAASKAAEVASGIASTLIIPVWIAVILSLVAAIASIIAIVQVTRKIAG